MDSHDNDNDLLRVSKMVFVWLLKQFVDIYGIPSVT